MTATLKNSRIEIDTDSLTDIAVQLSASSGTNHHLSLDAAVAATRVAAVLSLDPLGQGREAASILTSTGIALHALSATNRVLGHSVERARDSYVEVEKLAASILETQSAYGPEIFYVLGRETASDGVVGEIIADKLPFAPLISQIGSRLLFGMGYYADIQYNGEEFARKRRDEWLKDAGMTSSWRRDTGSYLLSIAKKSGAIRDLKQTSVRVESLSGNTRYEDASQGMHTMPVTAAEWAHNLELVGNGEDKLDELDATDGEIIEYDGVRVQVVRDAAGNVIAANVYLPGTDPDSNGYRGGLSTWTNNLATTQADDLDTLDEGTAMMKLTDRALQEAGIGADISVNMGGFSQGAVTVSALSTNKEFRRKYNLNYLYMQGGPVSDMKVSPTVPTVIVTDKNDLIPRLQGNSSVADRKGNVQTIQTDFNLTPEGRAKFKDLDLTKHDVSTSYHIVKAAPVHGYSEYVKAVEVAPNQPAPSHDLLNLREKSQGGKVDDFLVSGSSFTPGTKQAEISLNRDIGMLSGGYQITEDILDNTPTRGAALPDLPEDYSSTDVYSRFIEPLDIDTKKDLYRNTTALTEIGISVIFTPERLQTSQPVPDPERFVVYTPAQVPQEPMPVGGARSEQ